MKFPYAKILKTELFTLFFLTLVSFVAYYYQDSLPDNAYTITSSNESVSFLSYYLMSIVAWVGYYTGVWVFIPFVVFALFYAFMFSNRDYRADIFNFFSLTFACLFLVTAAAPEMVGKGVLFLIKSNFGMASIIALSVVGWIAFLAGSFRSSFKDGLADMGRFIMRIPEKTRAVTEKVQPKLLVDKVQKTSERFKANMETKVPSLLKREKEPEIKNPFERAEMMAKQTASTQNRRMFEAPVREEKPEPVGSQTENVQVDAKKVRDFRDIPTNIKPVDGEENEKKYYELVTQLSSTKRTGTSTGGPDDKYFEDIIIRIQDKLEEFNIRGQIIDVLKGPVVDTFELELGQGVKISKVKQIEEDLSMALYGAPIRIVYPLIGRTTMGIEVPRSPREVIFLDEVLSSGEYKSSSNILPIAMGKDAFGETFVTDLAGMPHMLVAGATGAGKSVFINTLLVSLLIKKSPRQMRLILIDPKEVELLPFSKIPHLIMPVVTDPKTAAISLMWAAQEMDKRYSILRESGVRNLEEFNEKVQTANPEMLGRIHQYYDNPDEDGYELPYIVIIVDEFADLILTKAGKEIENNICRLAAKARAAGIHLVLATQRPSVDVITGLIKSNFPTRISFRVTSQQDSRTILGTMGAEKLLGKGDMLYKHGTKSMRLHSSYVDIKEVNALTENLATLPAAYSESAMEFIENGGEANDDPYAFGSHINSVVAPGKGKDDKYDEAVKVVCEHGSASASMLQRRLNVGYNRASNLIDELEANGIVGPAQGSKPRRVIGSSIDL
jgi:DNA segregation ATPase FtsK/SpoIIIE, S-DNA-T family